MKSLLFVMMFAAAIIAQPVFTGLDIEICNEKFSFAVEKNLADRPINEVIVKIGKTFLGTDYVAHTLEVEDEEILVINLSGLDCTTFLENALVLARCTKKGETSFDDYLNELKSIRYRNGIINQYPSRIHYFSDWIYENDKNGVVKDVTKEIGGLRYDKEINFMTNNTKSYRQLSNDDFVNQIKIIEEEISAREYYFIPEENISSVEKNIHHGDLIAITSNIEGLDIAHVGVAVKMNDRIHFMHAPMVGKKVEITEKPLADYVKANKRQHGIMVARPLEP